MVNHRMDVQECMLALCWLLRVDVLGCDTLLLIPPGGTHLYMKPHKYVVCGKLCTLH